jgi:hypothetical protein
MKTTKRFAAIGAVAIASVGLLPSGGVRAQDPIVCQWGGDPVAPTGEVTLDPGATNTPSAGPLKLVATGPLAGGGVCRGKMTFVGVAKTGSTCAVTIFEGKVKGLPGVARFWGPGITGAVQEVLYDKDGNLVGADQPLVLLQDEDHSQAEDCASPEGFTHARFSSTVELFGIDR